MAEIQLVEVPTPAMTQMNTGRAMSRLDLINDVPSLLADLKDLKTKLETNFLNLSNIQDSLTQFLRTIDQLQDMHLVSEEDGPKAELQNYSSVEDDPLDVAIGKFVLLKPIPDI